MGDQYTLHRRPRIAWTILEWGTIETYEAKTCAAEMCPAETCVAEISAAETCATETCAEETCAAAAAVAFSKGNSISDKLVTAAGAHALLMLPEKGTIISPASCIKALLIKFPKNFNDRKCFNLRKDDNKPSKSSLCKKGLVRKNLEHIF